MQPFHNQMPTALHMHTNTTQQYDRGRVEDAFLFALQNRQYLKCVNSAKFPLPTYEACRHNWHAYCAHKVGRKAANLLTTGSACLYLFRPWHEAMVTGTAAFNPPRSAL
eukprot:3938583-Amphidinium_carterae.1